MKKVSLFLVCVFVLCSAMDTVADIYQYIDGEGVMHLTPNYSECKKYNCTNVMKERIIQKHKVRGADKNTSSAVRRETFILSAHSFVFLYSMHLYHWIELIGTVSTDIPDEYFKDLKSRGLAFNTNGDMTVYIFDHCDMPYSTYGDRVKTEEGAIVGWIPDSELRKIETDKRGRTKGRK